MTAIDANATGRQAMQETISYSAAPSVAPAFFDIVPGRLHGLFASVAVLTGAVFGILTSFEVVRWSPAQTTLVATELAAFWALAAAVTAHLRPHSKKQPVAIAGTMTAFASSTLSLGAGFRWWEVNQAQNASLMALATAIVAVGSAMFARKSVTAKVTT